MAQLGPTVEIRAIAVVNDHGVPCSPCGACRQVIDEFGDEKRLVMRAVGSELFDLPRVIGVVFKLAVGRTLCPGCRGEDK